VFVGIPIYCAQVLAVLSLGRTTGLTYNYPNSLTLQAVTMQMHGLPNDILSSLNTFALLIRLPVCDLLVYTVLWHVAFRFALIKKIVLGFFTSAAVMCWTAVVQHYIYQVRAPSRFRVVQDGG